MDQLKKIVYLTYDGLTDSLGQSQILPYVIGLSKRGYQFEIISFEKKDKFEEQKKLIENQCNTHNIAWKPMFYTKKPPILSTLYDIYRLKRAISKTHKQTPIHIIHCRSYITAFAALKFNNLAKIFDMRGFWADERLEGNIWNKNKFYYRLIYNFVKRKEIEMLNSFDQIIVLTHNAKRVISETFDVKKGIENKITVIPCCVDLDKFCASNFSKKNIEDKKVELGLSNDEFIIGYVGSIGTWYLLDDMISFFKKIKNLIPNSKFLLVTNEKPIELFKEFEKYDIDKNDIRIVSSPHNEVPLYISIFNYSLYFIRPTFSKKASSPTKQAEILAMGKPIITNSGIGDSDELFKMNDCGYLLQNSNETLSLSQLQRTYNPNEIRAIATKNFYLEGGVNLYNEVYTKITSSISKS